MKDGLDPRMPFSIASLAKRWACSQGAVRNLLRAGRLPHFRIGTLIRIPAAEVEKFEMTLCEPDSLVLKQLAEGQS